MSARIVVTAALALAAGPTGCSSGTGAVQPKANPGAAASPKAGAIATVPSGRAVGTGVELELDLVGPRVWLNGRAMDLSAGLEGVLPTDRVNLSLGACDVGPGKLEVEVSEGDGTRHWRATIGVKRGETTKVTVASGDGSGPLQGKIETSSACDKQLPGAEMTRARNAGNAAIRACYQRLLAERDRPIEGRIRVRVRIRATVVEDISLTAPPELGALELCIRQALSQLRFPAQEEEYDVDFPYEFRLQ